MNILILSSDYQNHLGGKTTHISMLSQGLNASGSRADVLCPQADFSTRLFVGISARLSVFRGRIFACHWALRAVLRHALKKTLSVRNFDVINAQDVNALICAAAAKNRGGAPLVLTVHGELAREMRAHGFSRGERDYAEFLKLERHAYSIADAIVCVDRRIRSHVAGLCPETEKIYLLQNFLDIDALSERLSGLDRRGLRQNFGISDNCRVVLVPRRFTEKCGIIYAVKAAAILKNQGQTGKIVFMLAGSGPDFGSISSYVQDNDLSSLVRLQGAVSYERMPEYYRLADAVLVPSISVSGYQEATSLAVLEGMVAGLPVIASNIGGLADIISHAETGLLVKERSPEEISAALIRVFEDDGLRKKIIVNASGYVSRTHHLNHAVSAFSDIYRAAMEKGAK